MLFSENTCSIDSTIASRKDMSPLGFSDSDRLAFREKRDMSITRAKKLLSGLRLHHLGFCFFWAVSFIVLSGLQAISDVSEHWRLYLSVEQVVTFIVVGSLALFYRKRKSVLPTGLALVAGFMLSGGALLYFLAFFLNYPGLFVSLAAGLLVGSANALFFLLWQGFFVTEGQQRAIIYIPLSAVLSIIIYSLTLLLPFPAIIFVAVVILPFLAMFTLHKSLSEIELYPITVITRTAAKVVIGDLWRPIFCVCAIGFVWKLIAQIASASGESGDFTAIAVLIGFGAAALLVALFELFYSKGFEILRMYQLIFPIITALFLLPTFFGMQYSPLLTGMLMFGFETVNLLLLVTCAVYAAKNHYSPIVMYGICVFPTLVFMSLGDALGSLLSPILAYDFAYMIDALFVCVYLLSLVLLFVSRGKKSRVTAVPSEDELVILDYRDERVADEVPAEELPEALTYLRECGLSPREIEVIDLLIKGNSVAAISRKLFISENTTRGHTKSIYKKLGIHSRQELVDMSESEFGVSGQGILG